MNRLLPLAILLAMAACSGDPGSVELSFQYNKQPGPGSNQYAVWVENPDGEVVKTLYVTQFTAKGRAREGQPASRGYTYRPSCTPTWVSHAGAENLTDTEIDAFTGATPAQSGIQSFSWDFTDQNGEKVAKGTYRIFLEATYNGESVVTYSTPVAYGAKAGDLTPEVTETAPSEERRDMITDVKVRKL